MNAAERVTSGGLKPLTLCIVMALLAAPSPAAAQVSDNQVFTYVLVNLLDYQWNAGGPNGGRWDGAVWVGGDYNKLWFKSEGQKSSGTSGDAEAQALYSRMISPFWNFQTGLRVDTRTGAGPHPVRTFAVVGFEGLAPYWFDLEPSVFIGDDGSVSARLTATYDLLFTQRLIGQPRLEMNATSRRAVAFDLGSGVNDIELGWRMRYEFRRELAPYVGISWERRLSETADLVRRQGTSAGDLIVVSGLRLWF